MNVRQILESPGLAGKPGDSIQRSSSTGSSMPSAGADRTLRLNRRFLLFTLLATLLLSWPLLAFNRPSYMQDSATYYKGGHAAVSYALAKLSPPRVIAAGAGPAQTSSSSATPIKNAAKEVSGARSITYSVAAYLLSAPGVTMVLLTIVQAITAAIVIVATVGAFGGLSTRRTTTALVVLAAASTVGPVSFLTVPDIFAGLLIGSMVLLTAVPSRLSLGLRLLCAAIAIFAVTAHASHIVLAAGMTILGIGWFAISRYRKRPMMPWAWAWIIAPLLIGGLTVVALNRVAFGEASLTSKRYPFALARSVDDGPGRWYLEKHCGELRYTICTLYPNGLPKGGALQFLWGKDGVVNRATPDQLDRIRAEEAEIVVAAAREYAGVELRTHAFNLKRQLTNFRPYPFDARVVRDQTGEPQVLQLPEDRQEILVAVGALATIGVVLGSIWLAWVFFKRRALRPVIALMFLGVLGNALTCVLLSAVSARYQARVVWLIPLFALAFALPAGRRSGHPEGRDA